MRIIFMGTPDFAVPTLRALDHAGHTMVAVYTQPPRPAGRGKQLQSSPVQKEAEILGIEVRSPKSLKSADAQAEFAALEADIAVVAAYGLILPQAILDAPRHGCLNVHASILPRWRGAAPIQRAVMAGDPGTGITIMQMEAGLDTGPMLATIRTPINDKTTGELTEELAEIGAQLMVGTLRDLAIHIAIEQDDEDATYAPKIDKAEARIDWAAEAEVIERQVRALAPFPGAWFELEGERVKLLRVELVESENPRESGDLSEATDDLAARGPRLRGRAGEEMSGGESAPGTVLDNRLTIACGTGAIRPLRLQRAGKPAMDGGDFLRGKTVAAGTTIS